MVDANKEKNCNGLTVIHARNYKFLTLLPENHRERNDCFLKCAKNVTFWLIYCWIYSDWPFSIILCMYSHLKYKDNYIFAIVIYYIYIKWEGRFSNWLRLKTISDKSEYLAADRISICIKIDFCNVMNTLC